MSDGDSNREDATTADEERRDNDVTPAEDDSEDGLSRRELLGAAGATTVAVLAGVGGYFLIDGNEITYREDEEDDGEDGGDEMSMAVEE